jgi:hypothetical protein
MAVFQGINLRWSEHGKLIFIYLESSDRSVHFAVDFIITPSEIYLESVPFYSVVVTTLFQLKQNDHCTVILGGGEKTFKNYRGDKTRL